MIMNTLKQKIQEYKNNLDLMRSMTADGTEVFHYIIDLGKKLQGNPLSEARRTSDNQVTKCQFEMYVDYEDGEWRAYSDGMISSGYAYILLDVFNSVSPEEAAEVKMEDFEPLGIQDLLTMNRATGFYQMIDIMRRNAQNVN